MSRLPTRNAAKNAAFRVGGSRDVSETVEAAECAAALSGLRRGCVCGLAARLSSCPPGFAPYYCRRRVLGSPLRLTVWVNRASDTRCGAGMGVPGAGSARLLSVVPAGTCSERVLRELLDLCSIGLRLIVGVFLITFISDCEHRLPVRLLNKFEYLRKKLRWDAFCAQRAREGRSVRWSWWRQNRRVA